MSEYDVWDKKISEDLEYEWGHPEGRRGAQHEELTRMVAELIEDKEVLDAGCGQGHLYYFLKQKGVDYSGFDRSREMVKIAHKFYPEETHLFSVGDVLEANKNYEPSDCVTCIDVLIHMPPELQKVALRELWKLTKKTLIFTAKLGNKTITYRRKWYRGARGEIGVPEGKYLVVQWNDTEELYGWINELDNVLEITQHEYEPRLQILKVRRELH